MAFATNTTPGTIWLGGDFVGTGDTPILKDTGVTAGTFASIDLTVDRKGRVMHTRTTRGVPSSESTFGTVVGDNVGVSTNAGNLTTLAATHLTVGAIRTGDHLQMVADTLSVTPGYAGVGVQGFASIGTNLAMVGSSLNLNIPSSSTTHVGTAKIDGNNINVFAGTISVRIADAANLGVVTTQDSSLLSIATGELSVGDVVVRNSLNNLYTQRWSLPTIGANAPLAYSPNLNAAHAYKLLFGGMDATLENPTNAVVGDTFLIDLSSTNILRWGTGTNVAVASYMNWKEYKSNYAPHVEAYPSHTVAIRFDDTLWTGGGNSAGELGNGTVSGTGVFPMAQIGTAKWTKVSSGLQRSIGVQENGLVYAWGAAFSYTPTTTAQTIGYNAYVYATDDRYICIDAAGNALVRAALAGTWSTFQPSLRFNKIEHLVGRGIGIGTAGQLYTYGTNTDGTLGNGSFTSGSGTFYTVATTDWSDCSVGDNFCIAIKTDGTLWGWGINSTGQIGQTLTVTRRSTPTQIGTDTNWASVYCGGNHTLAKKTDGTLWGWGSNTLGQVDQTTNTVYTSPVRLNIGDQWTGIQALYNYSIGTKLIGPPNHGSQYKLNTPITKTSAVLECNVVSPTQINTTVVYQIDV